MLKHFIDQKDWFRAAYSFDIFELTVELGSALGLWLGLSAVNCMDFLILYVPQFKNRMALMFKGKEKLITNNAIDVKECK